MLLTTTNNNLFDTFFSDPWFNDPWFDDRDVQKAQKKLYGHNGKRMMLTDIKESDKGYELVGACEREKLTYISHTVFIESVHRLIQYKNVRIFHHSLCKTKSLFHSKRIMLY